MQHQGAIRRRCCVAERERDIAIDEAAAAYFELTLLREEVAALRREKEAWEAGKDAWSHRHEQLLWHVGNMAEVLWHAMHQDDGRKVAPMLTVEEARLLALQTLEQLTIKNDAQLYEEMHDLYAKITQMETQQSRLMAKISELKAINVELASTIEANDERRWDYHGDQAGDGTKEDQQRPVEGVSTSDVGERLVNANEPATESSSDDESAAALLQAQLAMYVKFTKRHKLKAEKQQASSPHDDHAAILE